MNTTFNEAAFLSINKSRRVKGFESKSRKNSTFLKNKARLTVICISIFMCITICSGIIIAKAAVTDNGKSDQFKYYTSINIEKGDTLWSIASDYVNVNGSNTINNYVNDLKEINNLQTDCIYQGQNLIVYYYSAEYK